MKNTIILSTVFALSLMVLPGCLDKADRLQAQAPTISNGTATKADIDGKLADVVDLVGKRMDTSQNAIQSNMQSLVGVSVGKVSDDLVKLQTQFKNLAEFDTNLNSKIGDINSQLNASVASNNDLRLMLKAQMDFNASLVADVKLNAQFQADVSAKMEAMGAAQAGINNKIDQQTNELKENLSAGRDVTNTTTQFSKEMLDALRSANQTTSDTSKQWAHALAALFGVIGTIAVAYLHRQKSNAETRAKSAEDRSIKAQEELSNHRVKLERALAIMTTGVPDDPKK